MAYGPPYGLGPGFVHTRPSFTNIKCKIDRKADTEVKRPKRQERKEKLVRKSTLN